MNEEYLAAAKRNRERLEKASLQSKKKFAFNNSQPVKGACDLIHNQQKKEDDKQKIEHYHPSMYVGFGAKPASTYRNGKTRLDNALAVTSNQTR